YMIETEEFERLKKDIAKNNESIDIIYKPQKDKDGNIISHKKPRQTTLLELLEEWYKEDKNQIPLEDKNSTAYILQSRRRDEYAEDDPKRDEYTIYENWEAEENALRKMFQEAAESTLDESTPAYQKYFTSATEAEATEGITEYDPQTTAQKELGNAMDKEYVFGYLRTIDNPSGDYADQEESLKPSRAETFKKNLENTLLDKNIHPASYKSVEKCESSNFEAFEKYFYEHLKLVIDKQKEQTDSLTSLQKEQAQQQKFKNDKLKGFLGREETLSSISNYLDKETTEHPLIVYGPSGMGKSSLMAKAIEEAEQGLSNAHILYRFVGATQGSTTLRALLTSLCDELQEKEIIAPIESYESDENKFQAQIKEALSSIKTPVILFIDALDQLQKKDYLQWLPESLPDELKIIFSVLKDSKYEKDSHYFNLFEKRAQISQLIDITQDSLEPKKEELLTSLLLLENRKLQEDQKNYVLKQWEEARYSPLYLKIAIEEIKHWASYGDREKQILSESTEGIINEFIQNLSILYHHEPILVDKVFGYIHASKDGLSEKELLEILSEDLEDEEAFKKAIINDYHDPIKTKNPRRDHKEELMLPLSTWSRLHTHIKPFLVERDIDKQPLMKFFHRQFATVVDKHTSQNKRALHIKLGEYFDSLQDNTKTWDERYHNVHMLTELPYQYHMAEEAKKLKEILFDLEFAGSVYDNHKRTNFREILEKASSLEGITEDEIYPWESFYREKEHLIIKVDEELWRPHQSLFQLAYEDGLDSPLTKEAERLLEKDRVDFAWLKRRNRPEEYGRSGLIRVLEGHKSCTSVIELSNGNILSSSGDKTLRIWNEEGECLKVLEGHTGWVQGAIELSNGNILS
ncbi:MAG: AAA family ATPase, partial [Campylobacteraceae bacterium]|nr:AAA family ATPase [Campylobacteraceae bacterium]